MAGPYFTNRGWYQHPDAYSFAHSPSFRRFPAYQVDPTREVLIPSSSRPTQSQRVVRIPVHSRQVDRPGSALKIQKVFRGFLVRKCLQKIKDIRVEVKAIEDRLLKDEVVESIRRDDKERLKMSESLMSLLLKLDSICGLDLGVRSCRKAVIRKAIALQEKIDAIVAVDLEEKGETAETIEEEMADEKKGGNAEPIGEEMVDNSELKLGERGMEIDGENEEKGDVTMERVMKALCDKCDTQTRMIEALTKRVELLEKAFVCDKVRRQQKKKKKAAAAAARRDD